MSSDEIIRFWKQEAFQETRTDRNELPENPAGPLELSDRDLGEVAGGTCATIDPSCAAISISIGLSQLISCGDSILHGTCSGFSLGCCG